ncbi:MAG: TetR/AcrR family transcriptional regulator [Aeromicrobium sp.]|uniref:TetR/AcrR family transcriptional regulator n=1 Tax=Aeromicrobium sp. TaxID=1871063 RepID=UPI00260359E3|nr:TetR/AcrR family transcriptional regulator [Aeromicrobium sp.]MDF1705767.1 TetR/AcrR family transcriptional regulator [Aeromicrobium sp.]
MNDSAPRRPRRDALANRRRILDHAQRVMADEGPEISLHRIARDLGLGIGTVYRHFPTLDDLALAIYHEIQDLIDAATEQVAEIDDPYERVVAFVDITTRLAVEHPAGRIAARRVARTAPEAMRVSPAIAVVQAAVGEAQRQNRLRPDVGTTDVAVLAGMLADLTRLGDSTRLVVQPRMRALLLDAIAPEGHPRTPLPSGPLSQQQVTDAVHGED